MSSSSYWQHHPWLVHVCNVCTYVRTCIRTCLYRHKLHSNVQFLAILQLPSDLNTIFPLKIWSRTPRSDTRAQVAHMHVRLLEVKGKQYCTYSLKCQRQSVDHNTRTYVTTTSHNVAWQASSSNHIIYSETQQTRFYQSRVPMIRDTCTHFTTKFRSLHLRITGFNFDNASEQKSGVH